MVGAVGDDDLGGAAVRALRDEGIDITQIAVVDQPTGVALIVVDEAGENQIAVASGANDEPFLPDALRPARRRRDAARPRGLRRGGRARRPRRPPTAGWRVVLNPAPARELADIPIFVLTPNATEAAELSGEDDPEQAARALSERTGAAVLITLGRQRRAAARAGRRADAAAGDEGRRRRHDRRRRHRQRRARRRARPRRVAAPTPHASRWPPRRSARRSRARAAGCRAAKRSGDGGAPRRGAALAAGRRASPPTRAGSSRGGSSCATSSSSCRAGRERVSGLRAGVLSDLHAGVPHVGVETIRRAVDALNERAPDVHLLLGDYLDASQVLQRPLAPEVVARELARLRSAARDDRGDRQPRLAQVRRPDVARARGRGHHRARGPRGAASGSSGSPGWRTCATGRRTSSARCATSRPARR